MTKEIRLKGNPICRGIGIGMCHFIKKGDDAIPHFTLDEKEIDNEVKRYQVALKKSRTTITNLKKRLSEEGIQEGVAIFDALLEITKDSLFTENVEKEIRRTKKNAEYVFQNVVNEYKKGFESLNDPFFYERIDDIEDIKKKILTHLKKEKNPRSFLSGLPPFSIVFSRELTAAEAAEANSDRICAFVTKIGGSTSHGAIIARAKGIPYISNVNFENYESLKADFTIIDGRKGEVIFNPRENTLKSYYALKERLNKHLNNLKKHSHEVIKTADGKEIELLANVDIEYEIDNLNTHGGCGVGLVRSENIFLHSKTFPTEKQQYLVYKRMIKKMNGFPIVIRTFDFRDDKTIRDELFFSNINPYLKLRAIRLMLQKKEYFKSQLKAILRASYEGNVSIMFPMISTLSELREAKKILLEAKQELLEENFPFNHIPIGCMIEVPSAAIISDLLAKECDFLSVGTNDLTQYALAIDRNREHNEPSHISADPSLFRIIEMTVKQVKKYHSHISICGEMASDPRFVPLLIGLGVNKLSVSSRHLPIIKYIVENTNSGHAKKLAKNALSSSTSSEIYHLIKKTYKEKAPEDCLYYD